MNNTTPLAKAGRGNKGKKLRLPTHADYSDVVTDEHLDRIKTLVPDDDHKDAKVTSGPAW